MTDYQDLKRLAEAATKHLWSPRIGLTLTESDFAERASPAAVLALISENERLSGECEGCPMSVAEELRVERDQLKVENEALRSVLTKISAYAPWSGIKDPGFTKMHMGILARDAIKATMSKADRSDG